MMKIWRSLIITSVHDKPLPKVLSSVRVLVQKQNNDTGGLSIEELRGILGFATASLKIITKLVFHLGYFVPKSLAQDP